MNLNGVGFTLIFLFIVIPLALNLINMGINGFFRGSLIMKFNGLLGFFPTPASPAQKRALAQSVITGFKARIYGFFLLMIGLYFLLFGLYSAIKFGLQILHIL